jgi:hypothetical protein
MKEIEPLPNIVRPTLAGVLLAPTRVWHAQEASMIELVKSDGMAADHLAIKQLHVRPALGIALLMVMAICTAASVFAAFGLLVWWLVFQ